LVKEQIDALGVKLLEELRHRRIAARLGPDSIGRTADLRVIRGGAVVSVQATISARPPT